MKNDKKFLFGIVGSIIGAFIGALPWLLAFTFGNVIVGLLSIFIAIGCYYGYKVTKNEVDKRFSIILVLSTILVITTSFLVIMPIIRQAINGYNITFEWIPNTLKNWDLLSSFLFDYIVSLGIALIGAVGVIVTVAKNKNAKMEAESSNPTKLSNSKILFASIVAITIIAVIAIFGNNKNTQENTNNNASQNPETIIEIRENEHIISNTNIKFTPKDGLMLLTNSEKKKYKNVIEYDFIAMNEKHTKMLYCFIDYGTNIEGQLSAKDYIEQAFDENSRTEVTPVTMANIEFQKTNLNLEEAQDLYVVECYIAKIGDKFLCFNYWYPKTEQSNLGEMLETIDVNE